MSLAPLSERAKALILEAEGLNRPGKWPGGASGITIGFGYDLGQVKVERFVADWGELLRAAQLKRLKAAVGLKGAKAQAAASGLADIVIKKDVSLKVFLSRTIPEFQRQAEAAFPGLAKLPADAQGALVSLVYNRGPGMAGDRRKEMQSIRDAVTKGDLKAIALQLRAMKRLWVGLGLPGLLKRRDAEAALVESCLWEGSDPATRTLRARALQRNAPPRNACVTRRAERGLARWMPPTDPTFAPSPMLSRSASTRRWARCGRSCAWRSASSGWRCGPVSPPSAVSRRPARRSRCNASPSGDRFPTD